jgi:deazaflavin-dependent oxidoreductase (nitroreductase family)
MMLQTQPMARVPAFVRIADPLVRRLLGIGLPMGPNALLTVRGRRSGEPRSAGVAVVEIDGRRWVIGAYGEVNWVRNLRAAGEAELRTRGRSEAVRARELEPAAALAFFRDCFVPHVRAMSLPLRLVARLFAGRILADPEGAARRYPVFELAPAPAAGLCQITA